MSMYYLEEVQPRIFCVTFHEHYHMAMTFFRYSEGVEGFDKLTEGPFTISYAHQLLSRTGSDLNFTYAEDWGGFNLNSASIEKTISNGIIDINEWDHIFLAIYAICKAKYPNEIFAIIGIPRETNDDDVLPHEIAHGFFCTDEKYRNKTSELFNKIPKEKLDMFLQVLKSWGYSDDVLIDETQAYLSTSVEVEELEILDQMINLQSIRAPFIKLFSEKYNENFRKTLIIPHLEI